MTDYIKREDLLELYDLGGLEVENAKVPLNVVIQTIKDMPSADVVEIKKEGEWEMFDLISSTYYGKGMYFKQDNEIVYSRYSNKYMTVNEAIKEFISFINEENIAFVPSVTTTWADGEAPTYGRLKKGKWLKKHDKISYWHECSECGEKAKTNSHFNVILSNYCPNCGADMRELK